MIIGISGKSLLLAHLVYARIGEHTCIMHMTRPTDVDVHEMSTVIYKSLHYYGVPAFSVVVVSRVLIWRNNGCVPSTAPMHWGKPSSLNLLSPLLKQPQMEL